MIKKIIIIGLLVVSLIPLLSFAEIGANGGDIPASGTKGTGLGGGLVVCYGVSGKDACDSWADLINSIEALIKFTFRLAVVAATISIAYAGFLFLTSQGDSGKIKQAKDIFGKVVWGFIIMLTAYLLVKLILDTLVSNKAFNLLE